MDVGGNAKSPTLAPRLDRYGHAQEIPISGISCECGDRVAAVVLSYARLIVHDEIHAYGWRSGLAEVAEHEVFHAEEPRRVRRVGATPTRPQIDVMPHLHEPEKNFAGMRTGASARDQGSLDIEEDVH